MKQNNLMTTRYEEGVSVLVKKRYIRITTGEVPINDTVYTVEVLKNDIWTKSYFMNVKKNDLFRIIDPSGQIVKDQEGCYNFRAIESSRGYDGHGIITIHINRENG